MNRTRYFADEEAFDRAQLESLQARKLTELLQKVGQSNEFYRRKLHLNRQDAKAANAQLNLGGLGVLAVNVLANLPFTTRREIEDDQYEHPPYGSNLTFPLDHYCRYHQTSGSMGRPVRWLDTAESWDWLKRCWGTIYGAAGIGPNDRFIFPFSFGPFIGFWAAFESAVGLGNLCIPAGGLTTTSRLRLIVENQVTVICCTPTYALRMAEVAEQEGIDIASSAVRALIVAGEPGGHIPATRQRIEKAWDARVFDHTGMTEIGSLGFECVENPADVHLIESECIVEVIDPATLEPLPNGEPGELVITTLGRAGSPLIRYRTGDQVRLTREPCRCGRHFARMQGGIIGRIDDMFIVRGNNVFPSALEAVIRRFAEVAEFRVEARGGVSLTQVSVEVEPVLSAWASAGLAERIADTIHDTFNFRADVRLVAPGTLPRFEMKARRFVRAVESTAGAST